MQKDYQKNLSICKKNIQDQRKAISDLDWRVYLKETYPECKIVRSISSHPEYGNHFETLCSLLPRRIPWKYFQP